MLIENEHVCEDKTRHFPQNPFYSSVQPNNQESEGEQNLFTSTEKEKEVYINEIVVEMVRRQTSETELVP